MKLAVISSAPVIAKDGKYYGYSPYIRELSVWTRFVSELSLCCPTPPTEGNMLASEVDFTIKRVFAVREFNIKSVSGLIKAVIVSPINLFVIFNAMLWADHIHLRCPGNIGLMGCMVQILFPSKKKTAKYAGNWDPKAKQPLSYRLQKWILNNTLLTKNMQVLVYGKWNGSSKNIKPFFTATYWDVDKIPCEPRVLNRIVRFIFAGTLSEGKRPLYAVKIVEQLRKEGIYAILDIYGEGNERDEIERYIAEHDLNFIVKLHGNQNEFILREAYQQAHFLILPSKSEGWPKVVAEAMFWGCVPVSSTVSCIPFMLEEGKRGILLAMEKEKDVQTIKTIINDPPEYLKKAIAGMNWSRQYTMEFFEQELKRLLRG